MKGMKTVDWVDGRGYKRRAIIPENDPEELAPDVGIQQAPPDLDRLDWEDIKRDLHNELFKREIFDWPAVMREQNAVTIVVRRVITKRLLRLYREVITDAN